jgi:hypothetical protein
MLGGNHRAPYCRSGDVLAEPMKARFAAERCIDAPAAVVYQCLADYREHHRPGGFLPPAFEQLEITESTTR